MGDCYLIIFVQRNNQIKFRCISFSIKIQSEGNVNIVQNCLMASENYEHFYMIYFMAFIENTVRYIR